MCGLQAAQEVLADKLRPKFNEGPPFQDLPTLLPTPMPKCLWCASAVLLDTLKGALFSYVRACV